MSMDLDGGAVSFQPQAANAATILCCNCGAPIDGTTAAGALCYDCIKLTVDISEGIQREAVLHSCRDCDRWMSPPNQWLVAQPESRELLALCLRKLRGLNKVRIIDASFIWTEPHSRRVKVKITIQQEAFQNTILQQSFEVEYVLANQQCPDCAKSYTHNTWRACVQVRQKVTHKRTFLFLEQLILKHSAHKDTINIKETHEGIDFFFAARNQAEKFVDFLKSVVPVFSKKSQELISMDTHTSIKSYKFTFSVEIVPLCKDDLVVLPIKLAKQLGNIPPMTLCSRIGTAVQVLDPQTLQTADISPDVYWRSPFTSLADVTELVEFVVLDIEPLGPVKGRYVLAEATVARASDLGSNDQTFYTRTHLGGLLNVGDSVMGYHLEGSNFNNELFDELENSKQYSATIPDVLLVKKHYTRKKKNKRNWRVKRMAKEESEMLPRKQDQERLERDFEMFLRDVEEDEDFRAGIALYKSQHAPRPAEPEEMDEDDEEEDEGIKIPMDQLLEEMEDLNMDDGDEV
ncbi:putative nonsense-mediated mrna decay protein 3 protein [Neofusicoccum parvum UCRNP2]|uniref:60S ribosomal export protein NMD3 n=2 Tax=Neofusicoccum parvum TaxID=310453 RepID=R1EYZ4_BOTPV|nr:putative nonsense-mediated mrna decay protein 3 protein [Neofusicoccum parvum UCRNP2]GME21976.1 NMD3 domain-containing protein [Neofusicoccum parvum]